MRLLELAARWLGAGRVRARVLVLGLDHSGKSSVLRRLRPPRAAPDDAHRFTSGGVEFSAWDVSGAARARALWERHYRRADAVIFVVDSADHLRLVVAREELELMLAHPDMCGRRAPLLVLANKSDAPRALSPAQLAAALCLERVSDRPWHICASSTGGGEAGADGGQASGGGGELAAGVAWLARQLRDQHAARA